MTRITAKRRAEAATVHSGGKAKFPIDSQHTAKSAMKLIGSAKPPLSSGQKAAVRRKAAQFGAVAKSRPSSSKKK